MRLLIVEDEVSVRRLVTIHLQQQGLTVTGATTVAAALMALRHDSFDVAILDLTLPDGSGLEVLRALRDRGSLAHVIILSGVGGETDIVRALDLGADDYVVKPFSVRELTARVLAVRRRGDMARDSKLQYGSLAIDLLSREVTLDAVPLKLTDSEFELLAYLAARPRHVFSHYELLRSVWQSDPDLRRATVTEHVRRLRSKIEADPAHPRLLATVPGVGFRFDPPSADDSSVRPVGESETGEVGTFTVVDGRIVAADGPAVAMVGGASEATLLGRDALEFVAPLSQIAAQARRTAIESGRSPRSQVMALRSLEGTDIYVEVESSPSEWGGAPASRYTIRPSTDPSTRLRHMVTGVLSEVSDAVIISDPDLHIRSWNEAAERLYGWAEHEVLGRHVFDVIPFVEDDGAPSSAITTLEIDGRWHGEVQQVARDGSLLHIYASATSVGDGAGERVVVVFVHRPAVVGSARTTMSSDSRDDADIRRGLDGDEFDVHFQPVVAFDDLRIVAVEALIRWNHHERGVLRPGSFLDAAERSGLIVELGRVVFDKACRETASWRQAGLDIELAVNLSSRQLADAGFFDDITATLISSGLDPHALWLEVTETALVEDVDQAADLLHRLTTLGVRVSIDDFGTGWASLTYLKEFPVHALKIDQTFVEGVNDNPQDAAIARSILTLGRELDLVVVAEGVETVMQQSALQALGCTIGQGFLYGHPTPAAAVPTDRANRLPVPEWTEAPATESSSSPMDVTRPEHPGHPDVEEPR